MKKLAIERPLRVLALAGNVLFILWILFNGMDSGWQGTLPQKVSFVSLIGLLGVNSYYLSALPKRK